MSNEEIDISQLVSNALDEELKKQETEIAEKFGAIKVETPVTVIRENAGVADELQQLQSELAVDDSPEKTTSFEPAPPAPPAPKIEIPADPSKRTKDQIISDILKLQEALGRNDHVEYALKRRKKADLLEILGGLVKSAATEVTGLSEKKASIEEKTAGYTESIVNNLFAMNLLVVEGVERVGERFKDKTGGVHLLEGYRNEVMAKREALLPILQKIYTDNKVEIDKYMSPIAMWAMVMISCASNVAISNSKKKAEK